MNTRNAVIACSICILLAIAALAWAIAEFESYVHAESAQRVHTIGERCETTQHQSEILTAALGPANPQSMWFADSYARCLKSLAKVEARAGVVYTP